MNPSPLFNEAILAEATLPAERRLMRIAIGRATVQSVIDANMVGEVDSPLGLEAHLALREPEAERHRGIAIMLTIAMSPPAWGVLSRWARGRSQRIRQHITEGERSEDRRLARLAWRVGAELERLAAHPAYHASAVMGIDPTILPAYRVVNDDYVGPTAPTPDLAVKLADYAEGEVEVGEMLPFGLDDGGGRGRTVWLFRSPAPTPHPE